MSNAVPPEPSGPLRRIGLGLLATTAGLGLLLVAASASLNAFINLGLPLLINLQPERLRITYSYAWCWVPGRVEVRDLQIVAQGPLDQWAINIDRAQAVIDLVPLREWTFSARDIRATGGTFRYRVRKVPGAPDVGAVDANPEIPGLENPPNPSPEDIYVKAERAWRVELHDVQLSGMRDLWLGDFRFIGDGAVKGELEYTENRHLALRDAVLDLADGQVTLDRQAMAHGIHGRVGVEITDMNPATLAGLDALAFFTVAIDVKGEVDDVAFLSYYFREAPWLTLHGGEGELAVNMRLEQGRIADGGQLTADVRHLAARWFDYVVTGDGALRFAVAQKDGVPESSLDVKFTDYAIRKGEDAAALVEGAGFVVSATSPDVALDKPFTQVALAVTLPDARVPDFANYNRYLPREVGLTVVGGTGRIDGALKVSTTDMIVSGALHLAGNDVRARAGKLSFGGDFDLYASLPSGDLNKGRYDASGSRLTLRDVRLVDGADDRKGKDGASGWWATVDLKRGTVQADEVASLDATLAVKLRDTVPLITVFSSKEKLPVWIREMLAMKPARGTGRIVVGGDVVRVSKLDIHAGPFHVQMKLKVNKARAHSVLLVEWGPLASGFSVDGEKAEVHPFSAREWFAKQPAP